MPALFLAFWAWVWYTVPTMEISLERYRGMKLCVALSGGLDSVCLLHYLYEHAAAYQITLSAAHLDHGIRGEEAVRDALFCEKLCAEWGIPLYMERADVPALVKEHGGGVEEVARAVRYAFFRRIVAEKGVDAVATAHHLNDVAETVLFRLARGTSPAGMRAITEYEGIVRPLLSVTRAELEAYADEKGLYHVQDSTNENVDYTRNYIRHTVFPALEKISPRAQEHFAHFAHLTAEDDAYLEGLACEKIVRRLDEELVPIDLPDPLFFRACLHCMRQSEIYGYTSANFEEIARLRTAQSGKRVCLPNGRAAIREGGYVVFFLPELFGDEAMTRAGISPESYECPFTNDVSLYTMPAPFAVTTVGREGALRVDLDAFPEGCVVRTRREGDFITPYGGRQKSLKKFLTGRKISARLGRKLPLIASGSEVLVVVGVEISDMVKVTEKTIRSGYVR